MEIDLKFTMRQTLIDILIEKIEMASTDNLKEVLLLAKFVNKLINKMDKESSCFSVEELMDNFEIS